MCAYIKYINIMENSYFMWLYVDLFMIAIKLLWHYYKHCYNYHKINITKPSQINTLYYCSVLSLCPVFSFPFSVHKKKNKYIYHLIIKTIIIIILILGIFSCPCVVWVLSVCVLGGEQWLVKTFTSWQVLGCWQVLGAVSEAERYWGLFFAENNGGIWGVILLWE